MKIYIDISLITRLRITENWLALREKQSGSIYSIDSNEEIEKLLMGTEYMDHQDSDECLYLKMKLLYWKRWSSGPHLSRRAGLNRLPPLRSEQALNKVRETYWAFITIMVLMDTKITKEKIIRWSRLLIVPSIN